MVSKSVRMLPLSFLIDHLVYPSGVLVSFAKSRRYFLIITGVLLVTVLYILAEGAFYIAHLDNLNEATTCMGTLAFSTTSFIRVLILLCKNNCVYKLVQRIREMQSNSPSKWSNEAEQKSRFYTICLMVAAYVTLPAMMIAPLVNMYLEYRSTGHVIYTRWSFPYKMV